MNKTQEQLEKLREVAESSLNKTDELQKVLAQIEALMIRTENQKVSEKSKDWISVIYKVLIIKFFRSVSFLE